MSTLRKKRRALLFVIFIGFAILIREIVGISNGEIVNVQLIVAGVLIVAIGAYFSRRLMPDSNK